MDYLITPHDYTQHQIPIVPDIIGPMRVIVEDIPTPDLAYLASFSLTNPNSTACNGSPLSSLSSLSGIQITAEPHSVQPGHSIVVELHN